MHLETTTETYHPKIKIAKVRSVKPDVINDAAKNAGYICQKWHLNGIV